MVSSRSSSRSRRSSASSGADSDAIANALQFLQQRPASAEEPVSQANSMGHDQQKYNGAEEQEAARSRLRDIPASAVASTELHKTHPQSGNTGNQGESTSGKSIVIEISQPLNFDRDAYRSFEEEYTAKRVIKHWLDRGEAIYEIKFMDGHFENVSFERVRKLPNGQAVLDAYDNHEEYTSDELDDLGSPPFNSRLISRPPRTQSLRKLKQSRISNFMDLINPSSNVDDTDESDESDDLGTLEAADTYKPQATRLRRTSSKHSSQTPIIDLSEDEERTSDLPNRRTRQSKIDRFHQGHNGTSSKTSSAQDEIIATDDADEVSSDYAFDEDETPRKSARRRRADDDYEDFPLIVSDVISNSGRAGKRKRTLLQSAVSKRRRTTVNGLKFETPKRSEGERRSTRSGRNVKSMAEKLEDDIYHTDDQSQATPTAPRAVGAREIFKDLPKTNAFRNLHLQHCDVCGENGSQKAKGKLVYCQGCTFAYHKACMGHRNSREHLATKVAEDEFVLQCRRCIRSVEKKDPLAPRQDICPVCKESGPACKPLRERKTARQEEKEREDNGGKDPITEVDKALINNAENILFRCVSCYRGFHFHHLPPRNDHASPEPGKTDTARLRRTEYCTNWKCKECSDTNTKIDSLVAWRPVNEDHYTPGFSADQFSEDEKEYLIKWHNLSYYRATWMPGPWVWGVTMAAMRKSFLKRNNGWNHPKMTTEDAIPEEFLRVDIVFDVEYTNFVDVKNEEVDKARVKEVKRAFVKYKGLGHEDTVWEDPPDPEDGERWIDFVAAYEDWVAGRYVQIPKKTYLADRVLKTRGKNFEKDLLKKTQPASLSGGELMAYQMEGMNWLYYQWYKSHNAILADEMGLGKTIQVIAFLATLIQDVRCFPFLIVVPNSTCPNWRREIKKWAPALRVVSFYGSQRSRDLAYNYELFPEGSTELRCHIVVTSYEAAADEKCKAFFRKVSWAGLVVDEGQRLKNDKSLLYSALNALKAPFRLLLTGTPLQNNARELFNLLQFLDRDMDASQLEEEYSEVNTENISKLHDLIRPFFLRRTKAQVLTFLPPMAQIIIPVTMSIVQKKLYKSILAKNPSLIKAIFNRGQKLRPAEAHNLNNILMQLRKCLCHPFVYSQAIEERSNNAIVSHQNLVGASSKLQLLELMLPKLRERGHRVLIFTQFLDMLNIMEDFLEGLGMPYQRLDGSINSLQKQKRIDEFNAPNSSLFAFLLSTRAGGVGINLATADTVIILDPDFNPHQDIQALSRAHRIGQKKKVLVFQLMTRDSAEEKIVQIGRKKMALDHVLIENMDAQEDDVINLESILRHGAEALFDDNNERDVVYDSTSVDKLLDRSQAENTKTGEDNSAESQFSFARIWQNQGGTLEDELKESEHEHTPDPSLWEKILSERERAAEMEAVASMQVLGRGKRRKKAIDYADKHLQELMDSPEKANKITKQKATSEDSDTDFQDRDLPSEEEPMELDPKELLEEQRQLNQKESSSSKQTAIPANTRLSRTAENGVTQNSAMIPPSQNANSTTQRSKANDLYHDSKVSPFRRAVLPDITTIHEAIFHPAAAQGPTSAVPQSPYIHNCPACDKIHPIGSCPVKIAGPEHCPLCGIAHFGVGRTCPHLNSESQIRLMLEALKHSTEPKEVRDTAKKYLTGIKADLVRRKRAAFEQAARFNAIAAASRQEILPPASDPRSSLPDLISHGGQNEFSVPNSMGPSAYGIQPQDRNQQTQLNGRPNSMNPYAYGSSSRPDGLFMNANAPSYPESFVPRLYAHSPAAPNNPFNGAIAASRLPMSGHFPLPGQQSPYFHQLQRNGNTSRLNGMGSASPAANVGNPSPDHAHGLVPNGNPEM